MIFLIHLVLCAGENRWDEGRLLCHRSQSGFTVQNSIIGIGMRSSITLKCSSAARQLEFNRFFKISFMENVLKCFLNPPLSRFGGKLHVDSSEEGVVTSHAMVMIGEKVRWWKGEVVRW